MYNVISRAIHRAELFGIQPQAIIALTVSPNPRRIAKGRLNMTITYVDTYGKTKTDEYSLT